MNNYLIYIINIAITIVITIPVSIITVKIYLHFNLNKIINNLNNINVQNNANQIVINYLNEKLSNEKINGMIDIRINEALKNRPRIFTFKNEEEMLKELKIGDIAIIPGAKYQNVGGVIREI